MATSLKKCVEQTAEQATNLVADLVKSIICESVALRNKCYIALAGGTTPRALYQRLAAGGAGEEVPWMDVEIFFGDERDVPLDHVESNYNMVQHTMLDHLPIEPSHVHPMRGDAEDLDAAAAEYERAIRGIVPAEKKDGIPRFDLILLGMGGDGHTASLFPNTAAVDETKKLVTTHPVSVLGRQRLTFTFPLLNAARNIILLVTGGDKAEAVAGLLSKDHAVRSRYPAAKLQPTDGLLAMVFDTAAARRT